MCAGNTPRDRMRHSASSLTFIILHVLCSACALHPSERLLYVQEGASIGIESDATINRSVPQGLNSHPVQLTPDQIRLLGRSIQVSGWSGTLAGLLTLPPAIPLFKPEELDLVAGPFSVALNLAGPEERVFFSLPNRTAPYSEDRTTGALFVRGPYLHVLLTDHSAFIRADTGGGDEKDLRDTKGMKLSVVSPIKPAVLTETEQPRWGPFEKVHISVAISEALAVWNAARRSTQPNRLANEPDAASQRAAPSSAASDSPEDLRRQIRELTDSNRELQIRLDEQTQLMKALKDEITRFQRELDKLKTKSRRKPPP